MQKSKFKELLKGYRDKVLSQYKLDIPPRNPKILTFFPTVTKDLLKPDPTSADDLIADFFHKLLFQMRRLELTFFYFFECKNIQLIRPGDKGFD